MNKVSFNGISEWFTGKAAEKAKWAVDQVNASLVEGEWLPKVARTVRASFNKVSGATQKLAREIDQVHKDLPYFHKDFENDKGAVEGLRDAWFAAFMGMYFGSRFEQKALKLMAKHVTPEQKHLVAAAERFYAGFAPIWEAMAFLDAQRPKPTFVMKTLSPTTARHLVSQGYKPDSVGLPEFIFTRDEEGNPQIKIIWPKGTKHGRSKFSATNHNFQCQACGHAIKNGFNWVPLYLVTETGEIHSFWVGRDCAKKLFGVEMKGDAKYLNTDGR